jgi:hypothetical protein
MLKRFSRHTAQLSSIRISPAYAHRSILFRQQRCLTGSVEAPMPDGVIANMKARADQCRRLLQFVSDQRTVKILRDRAQEIEADIRQLEADKSKPR